MKALTLLFFGSCLFTLNAQVVNIPDPAFKGYLLNQSSINTNGDSEIQVSEATAFTDTIAVVNQGVTSIVGIEAFVNLTCLSVSLNNISSVDLSQNTQLKAFICPFNNLSFLDVSNNLLMEELVLWDNNLNSLDVTMLPQLRRLEINSNSISSLDITQNPLLEKFYASGNMIGNKDYTMYPNLYDLELNGCGVTSIDLSNNPLLTRLQLMINDVSSLDFSNNPLLENMRCDFNEMVTLDLSMCPNLVSFGCYACDNLETVNIQNGNNSNFVSFQVNNSANVNCVQVDDVAYSTMNWTSVDDPGVYSVDCGQSSLDEQGLLEVVSYPNPVSDQVTIVASQPIERVQIYSEIGSVVLEEIPHSTSASLNLSQLPRGVYIVHIYSESGHSKVERIVKSR